MKTQPNILIVGREDALLQSRKLLLGTYFHVETAGRVSHAAQIVSEQSFNLIVLCYSLTDEESQKVVEMVAHQDPPALILALSCTGRPCAPVTHDAELSAEDGLYALVKQCAKMLGVEMKAAGRSAHPALRRVPAFRF